MKSLLSGLLTIAVIGIIGVLILRARGIINFPGNEGASPSPSSVVSNWDMEPEKSPDATPTPQPSSTPYPTVASTTKGGVSTGDVKGVTSTTVTTTTKTVTHVNITMIKTSDCGSFESTVKEIDGPLTLNYKIKDNYTAAITVWNDKGEELVGQSLYTGEGTITKIENESEIKVKAESNKCEETDDTWLTISATR